MGSAPPRLILDAIPSLQNGANSPPLVGGCAEDPHSEGSPGTWPPRGGTVAIPPLCFMPLHFSSWKSSFSSSFKTTLWPPEVPETQAPHGEAIFLLLILRLHQLHPMALPGLPAPEATAGTRVE